MTSSNYDKNKIKHVGGKNGYGAKLTNIFSNEFIVETVDYKRKKKFLECGLGEKQVSLVTLV